MKDRSELDRSLAASLQRAYNLKAVADYETGPDSDIAPERAVGAIEDAGKFVSAVQNALRDLGGWQVNRPRMNTAR